MLADPEALPALATIGAGEDLTRGAGEDGLGAIDADRRIMDIGIVQSTGDARPALSAVRAAPHAIDLDTRPYETMVRRINGQCRNPRDTHIRAFFGHVDPEFFPVPPAVVRSEERRRAGAREDDLRIGRIEGHFPHMKRVHWRIEPLETLPAIFAEVNAVIGAGQDGARPFWMNREPEHPAFGPK